MNILHLADLHVGVFRYGRKESIYHTADIELHSCVTEILSNEKPDLILIAGDIYDNPHPSTASRAIVNQLLMFMAEICPVVLIAGNHDLSGRISALQPEVEIVERAQIPIAIISTEPQIVEPLDNIFVYAVPYIRDTDILRHHMKSFIRAQSELKANSPESLHILLAHFPVPGCNTESGRIDVGETAVYGWAETFDYIALGDIHVRQPILPNVWYAGSPRFITFPARGRKIQKGYISVDCQYRNNAWSCNVVEKNVKSARIFETVTITKIDDLADILEKGGSFNGKVVRAIIESNDIPASIVVERIYEAGADFVKPEYFNPGDNDYVLDPNVVSEFGEEALIVTYLKRTVPEHLFDTVYERMKDFLDLTN